MSSEIKVPTLGESVTEATVGAWSRRVGEPVSSGDILVELETDKVTVEVYAPADGVLAEIKADEGDEVEVGAVLAVFAQGAGGSVAAEAPAEEKVAAETSAEPALSPAVHKLIEENHLDPATINGTGKDGRLTKDDVLKALEGAKPAPALAPAPAPAPAPKPAAPVVSREAGVREEKVKMTRLRQKIAERLKEAQNTAAMLTTFNEVDMTAAMTMRNKYKDQFLKKHGVKLGFMSIFVKAAVQALKEWPAVNAEISGTDIIFKNHYDIGVAVGTPNGLVVPVLRDCDAKSFADIEGGIADMAVRARDGKLSIDELTGGTFTITNGGIYGSLMSTPILNPPQSGILGMHAIKNRAMVMPDGSIHARPMMYIALSYDHRIVDGREAVSFLVRVKDGVEDPERLLIEV